MIKKNLLKSSNLWQKNLLNLREKISANSCNSWQKNTRLTIHLKIDRI